MLRRLRHTIIVAATLLGTAYTASAQYYTWGADAPYMHWHKSKDKAAKLDVIFPDTAAALGYRMMYYAKATQPSIGFGFRHGPMKIPFIIHPENLSSNGLVMWLPKRVEILSAPAINSYSMPWLKQLAAHEYRHAVQYNNLNQAWVRAFSYLLGQQSKTIGLLFMPLWGLEGDAVLSETQMSSFGRALQPSFTMHYRAVGDFTKERRNTDKWFCGSYREHIPDHYHIGYQITAYADTKYDENIWNKVVRYAVRNPYVFATTAVAMRKYYNTSTGKLVRETFGNLNSYWAQLPKVEDSAKRIDVPALRSYTTYSYPIPYRDGQIISVKEDLDTPSAIVITDTTNTKRDHRGRLKNERRVCFTGRLSTRPTLQGDRLWWTEYRRSLLFAERINSRLCYTDINSGRTRTIHRYRNILYPTAINEKELAWVEYSPSGIYTIVRGDMRHRYFTAEIPLGIEVHGLAYDNYTHSLYFIATGDGGMWVGRVTDNRGYERVTKEAYITISDLRAKDGVLYFGSIASGKDEAHCYDLREGREYRISTSAYGSFSPMPTDNGEVLLTTYDRHGYHLTHQKMEQLTPITPSRLPHNIVNPPRKKWNVINLDTVRFMPNDSTALRTKTRTKRYHGAAHLFNIHSWAPFSYDPFRLGEEGLFDVNLGATIMSQNLLSTADGYLSWGWNASEGSLYRLGFKYFGLGLQMKFDAAYGGKQNIYALSQWNPINGEMEYQSVPSQDSYFSVGASLSLPLLFARGYHTRQLSLSAGWNYSTGLIANVGEIRYDPITGSITNLEKIGFREGLHKLAFSIGYSDMVRVAPREFAPRLGYSLISEYAFNPANGSFSDLISFYGKFYLPGFVRPQSLMLEMSYQTSIGGFKTLDGTTLLTYKSARLIPRGYSSNNIICDNYLAGSINYQIPVWYPEGGIPSVLYFKRIRLNLGFDYAHFNLTADRLRRLNSYGVDLLFDVNFFRMPDDATSTIKLSLYKPKHSSLWFGFGVGLPF